MKTLVAAAALVGALSAPLSVQAYTLTNSAGVVTTTPGAATFNDFDGTNLTSVATVSGGGSNSGSNPGGGGNWLSAASTVNITITFTALNDYFGLMWGSNDSSQNLIDLYNGATLLTTIVGNGNSAYTNIFASSAAEYFDRAVLRSTIGCCFEVDNLAARRAASVVPEPGALGLVGTGLFLAGISRRRKV